MRHIPGSLSIPDELTKALGWMLHGWVLHSCHARCMMGHFLNALSLARCLWSLLTSITAAKAPGDTALLQKIVCLVLLFTIFLSLFAIDSSCDKLNMVSM